MKKNLSEYIRDDLRARILSGQNVPEKLTLPVLAEQYDVSLMPVRIAVQELLEERVLIRQENGRLLANPRKFASQKSQKPLPALLPPCGPYDALLKEVLGLCLRGDESELKIVPCAERYGVSQSMIHSLFHRLAGQGLLEHAPRRGWRVRPYKAKDLEAYLTVREALELMALDLARDRLEQKELERLLALNQPGPERGVVLIDNSLHRYWVEKSENRYIQDFFDRHQIYYDMLLSHVVLKRQHIEVSRASHRRILEAMLQQDWLAAREELIQDIRRLSPLLQQTVERLEGSSIESTPRTSVVIVQ